jgi:hypothetical protein
MPPRRPPPLVDSEPFVSRARLAAPEGELSYAERLARARAVDLRDNGRLVELEDGYWTVEPVDRGRRHG